MFCSAIISKLAAAVLALPFAPPQTLPTHTEPMRNTFVVAAESVIDAATAVDIHAEDARFTAQIQQALAARDNLNRMTEDDREHDIASATGDLLFAVQACHIQAKDGASTDTCQGQIEAAGSRAMVALGKHKNGGAWVDGPPMR